MSIIVIRPIRDQMLFDRKQFSVEAGKAVEIVFDNVDIMLPTTLVITAPGAMIEVGQMAEKMGPAGQAKDFIPDTSKVLFLDAAAAAGAVREGSSRRRKRSALYPYVCTFPATT